MRRNVIVGAVFVVLSGCNAAEPVQEALVAARCDQDSSKLVVSRILSDEFLKQGRKLINEEDYTADVASRLYAAASRVQLTIEDVRTEKNDPNSTKRFCRGTLKISIPPSILADANEVYGLLGSDEASDTLTNAGLVRIGEVFESQIAFSVQPTDSGDKIFAEVEGISSLYEAVGGVFSYYALLPRVRSEIERVRGEIISRTKESAIQEMKQMEADLDLASAENKLANREINELWFALSPEVQAKLLAVQRAWINKKIAECNIRASEASKLPLAKETARLRCDTEYTRERSKEIAALDIR